MRVNQVVIIPAFTRHGNYGRYFGRFCEYDVVNSYVEPLIDYLEQDGVPFTVQKPEEPIYPNSLVLHCGSGWDLTPVDKMGENYSVVAYAQQSSKQLAKLIIESVSDWGKCYGSFEHEAKEIGNKSKMISLKYKETFAIYIEPYTLNGYDCEKYLIAGNVLGKMLAQCLFEFLYTREEIPKMQSAYKV